MIKRDVSKQQAVSIVTDSIAQVPESEAARLGISIIPFPVYINEQKYLDGVDLSPQQLYQRMRNEKILPTTSAPSPVDFGKAFRARFNAGAQAIVYVCLSSRLSSAYDNACQAAKQICLEFPGRTIEVFDSKQATISEGFIAMEAAKLAASGGSVSNILDSIQKVSNRCGLAVTLETLEFLARGGRIGKAAYLLGSLINVKPILTIKDGIVTPLRTARTNQYSFKAIVDFVAKKAKGCYKLYIGVMQADDEVRASELCDLAISRLHPLEIIQVDFTPVMGVHTGPGVVGLAYYYE